MTKSPIKTKKVSARQKAKEANDKKTTAKKPNDTKPNNTKIDKQKKSPSSAEISQKEKLPFKKRLLRWVRNLILLLIAYPLVMTLVYKIPFIHPVSHLMIYEFVTGTGAKREWLDLEDISPNLRRSVISSEDGLYCSHNGVDWNALYYVAENTIKGKASRGASTITMQTAKNLFLWNSRSYIRKGLEIPLAVWLDFVLGKKRVMEIYLNIAEWDKGRFGVEMGSQAYFKRSARDLTRKQAALLAVTLPNPKKRNAARPSRGMNRVGRIVQRRARNAGYYVKCVFDEKK